MKLFFCEQLYLSAALILLAGSSAQAGLRPLPANKSTNAVSVAPFSLTTNASSGAQGALRSTPPPTRTVPGQIAVKLKRDSATAKQLKQMAGADKAIRGRLGRNSEFGALLTNHAVKAFNPAFRAVLQPTPKIKVASRLDQSKRDGLLRWCKLELQEGTDAESMLSKLRTHPAVEKAEMVYEYTVDQIIDPPINGLPDSTTDPGMDQQWHHAGVRAQAAWNYLKQNGVPVGGSHDVLVAVIDSGVDAAHPELVGNMWTNPREIAGNGIDDDGNGFIDDIHGCSVVSDARSHSGDSTDYYGHGTHVAGIIAATAFNHLGGVGTAFNVQIMSVRAAQYSGNLTTTDISEAILYAVDNGAEVINMSFGGYQRSQIMIDALEVALNQAVLVAAAGNDGLNGWDYPHYPAALPFVHGVMASTLNRAQAWFSNYGYDLAAPGESIYSTLPGNQYAEWSGTSMAAPIVSGVAALMRSYWWQRDIYSSRFLMGGLNNAGNPIIDAYKAVAELPQPGVVMLENWLFDDKSINPRNDADGRVDSGETIHLAIEVMNRSGQANNIVATLIAHAEGAVFDDPYVTIVSNRISCGSMGPFNTADNGFIYNSEGVITGVEHPLVFQVAADCPNDHVIPFELTIAFEDGWNPSDPGPYTRVSRFNYVVQRGKNVPRIVTTNTVLSSDEYWMIPGPVLIESGATLTIAAGTQVQWGGISDDPYNPGPQAGSIIVRGRLVVQGTADQPVNLFPSYLVAGQVVDIEVQAETQTVKAGSADMAYVTVRNPALRGFNTIDHAYFDWDFGASTITANYISDTTFHKLRGGGPLSAQCFNRCLFDAGWLAPSYATYTPRIVNCTFLQDNENIRPLSLNTSWTIMERAFGGVFNDVFGKTTWGTINDGSGWCGIFHVATRNNQTYAILPVEFSNLQQAELIAQYFGGHVASITDQQEQQFLEAYVNQQTWSIYAQPGVGFSCLIGLTDDGHPGAYHWLDGTTVNYANWAPAYPAASLPCSDNVVLFSTYDPTGGVPSWYGAWRNNEAFGAYLSGALYAGGPAFILKLPGVWTETQLNAAVGSGQVLNYVRPRSLGDLRYNAFLSTYWDPNVSHWMRFYAPVTLSPFMDGARLVSYSSLNSNYWGTASETLIDHAIVDYNDDFMSAEADYKPAPTGGFSSTYPFADKVLIGEVSAETVPQVSAGRLEFAVRFNRDMNTNVEPFVTFGPSPPHTDFSVLPRDADFHALTSGWTTARTWQGSAWITPVTGDGYQLMRISGAVAADDPWLISGYDVGRIRFEVRTMGFAAMTLQASGQEGAIRLSWQQNDYDLLAGYNLYRSDGTNGPWLKLNDTVIPPGSEVFSDTNVVPAVPLFYRFTVLTTDMAESEPSNLASAAALDTIPPVMAHAPVTSAPPARGLRITASATDNVRVQTVTLFHRLSTGGSDYASVSMINVSSNDWTASIPGFDVQPPGVQYYLIASDGISQVFSGTPELPHLVQVSNVPTLSSVTPNRGSASGGTVVTLSGMMFEPGIGVLFGGALSTNVVLLTANQLTCLTPPHYPAMVDVTVINTNGTQSTLLNAFRFEDTGVVVSMPNTNGNAGTQVELALSAANVDGLRAVDATIAFDSSVLSAQSVRVGSLTAGWAVSANVGIPGNIVLTLASGSGVTGSGSLAVLKFNVVGVPPASTSLSVSSLSLNDGAIAAACSDGAFTVNGFFRLDGGVSYFTGGSAVPGADLALVGSGAFSTTSTTNGSFSFTNVPTGAYSLTVSKTNDVGAISAYDASLVLQAAAGLLTLSPNEFLAADVNRNGTVSAMDAAHILEKAVGLIEGPFPGAGKVWDFVPGTRSYGLLNSDLSAQDFTAVLIGDVSGNWAPPGPPEAGPRFFSPAGCVVAFDSPPVVADGERSYRLLLMTTNTDGCAVDTVISFSPTNRSVLGVFPGPDTGFSLAVNTNPPGCLRIGLASAQPKAFNGPLLLVKFSGSEPVALSLLELKVNEIRLPVTNLTDFSAFDTDHDGLIDFDEVSVFHTDPAKPDSDGDTMVDGLEVRAGTDPLNRASVFILRECLSTQTDQKLTWQSVPGRQYQLQCRDGLGGAGWNNVGTPITAVTDTAFTWDSGTPVETRFYRILLLE